MVIAGEWFAMWQSQTWNGQEAAFRFYVTALAVLIFVVLPDGDLAAAARGPAKKAAAAKRKSDRPPHRRRTDQGRRRTDTDS
jgi:hypothetical protein